MFEKANGWSDASESTHSEKPETCFLDNPIIKDEVNYGVSTVLELSDIQTT